MTGDQSPASESLAVSPTAQFIACTQCVYWKRLGPRGGLCRRHGPRPGSEPSGLSHWPETQLTDGCGAGALIGAEPTALVHCESCQFWRKVGSGEGLFPTDKHEESAAWWLHARYCKLHAPLPGPDIAPQAFWLATNAHDGCGDGQLT